MIHKTKCATSGLIEIVVLNQIKKWRNIKVVCSLFCHVIFVQLKKNCTEVYAVCGVFCLHAFHG